MAGKGVLVAALVLFSFAGGVRSAAAEVQLTIKDGRVSLSAKNATVVQILGEWAKVGQTKIVNPERAAGGPITIELTNVPEIEAIEILLRAAGGYLVAPRRTQTANASLYDRILILPPSAAVSSSPRVSVPAAAAQPRPFMPPPAAQPAAPQQQVEANDEPAERPNTAPAVQSARPPVFNTFPQAPPRTTPPPASAPAPTSSVTAPVGVAVPGMVVPTPQPAGQPAGQPATTAPDQQR